MNTGAPRDQNRVSGLELQMVVSCCRVGPGNITGSFAGAVCTPKH